jgi:hypothetical protein
VRFSRLAGLTTAGLLALAVAAPAGAADDAHVRVLHGSSDAPSVDVFVNDTKVDALSGIEFGDITAYVAVPGDTYSIKVCATADNTVCPIGPVDLEFEAGKKYTIAASDLLAQIKADVFVDGNGRAGEARVRAVHLSADTPNVDVRPDGGEPVLTDLPYRSASSYLALPGGAYDLEVCATGTDTCPLDLPEVDVEEGTAYSVFAIGQLAPVDGQQALTAVVAVDGVAAPATDTVGETAPASSGTGFAAVLLAAAAALGVAGSLRYAAARNRAK